MATSTPTGVSTFVSTSVASPASTTTPPAEPSGAQTVIPTPATTVTPKPKCANTPAPQFLLTAEKLLIHQLLNNDYSIHDPDSIPGGQMTLPEPVWQGVELGGTWTISASRESKTQTSNLKLIETWECRKGEWVKTFEDLSGLNAAVDLTSALTVNDSVNSVVEFRSGKPGKVRTGERTLKRRELVKLDSGDSRMETTEELTVWLGPILIPVQETRQKDEPAAMDGQEFTSNTHRSETHRDFRLGQQGEGEDFVLASSRALSWSIMQKAASAATMPEEDRRIFRYSKDIPTEFGPQEIERARVFSSDILHPDKSRERGYNSIYSLGPVNFTTRDESYVVTLTDLAPAPGFPAYRLSAYLSSVGDVGEEGENYTVEFERNNQGTQVPASTPELRTRYEALLTRAPAVMARTTELGMPASILPGWTSPSLAD